MAVWAWILIGWLCLGFIGNMYIFYYEWRRHVVYCREDFNFTISELLMSIFAIICGGATFTWAISTVLQDNDILNWKIFTLKAKKRVDKE